MVEDVLGLFREVGQKYQGFVVTKSVPIPEIQCHLIELVHEKSGACVMHIANADPENLFSLSFRTLPESSSGVAHILEHTVLCGSRKFPVKDPFFAMNQRSLNTFMNALTGADFTCYPAASQVEKDFYNLLEVYLDAVFHPLLQELSFSQEGHRLEFSNPDDPTSPLEYKGIVFNEMKGALSSPTTRLLEAVTASLFPGSPYGYNSGGDPKEIPQLTYEELLAFHRKYYHPSRCLFFFYGNLALEKHLDFISKHILDTTAKQIPLPQISPQKRFTQPVRKELEYPISQEEEDLEDKSIMAFGWLTASILDPMTILALSVLEIVLMDTDASPLKLEILKSGLCTQASSIFDTESSEAAFVLILRGCKRHSAQDMETLIYSTLARLSEEGIPEHMIESALHQVELARCEITGDSAPFGLSLFMRAALPWQHGGPAENGLRIHSLFEELRSKFIENPAYLRELISKYFLTNPHFVRIIMHPSKDVEPLEIAQEREKLDAIRAALTDEEIRKIVACSKALAEFQEVHDEKKLELLPKISVQDVPKKARNFTLSRHSLGSLEIFHHATFTNEIAYADLVFPIPKTAEDDLWLLRLFSFLAPQVGMGTRSYQENLSYIQEHTGGVWASLSMNVQAENFRAYTPSLHLRGKSLYRKQDKLYRLLFDMATSLNFTDQKRLKELVLKHFTGLQSTLNQSALKYAVILSTRHLSDPCRISDAWSGLEYFYKIKDLAQNFDKRASKLLDDLQRMQEHLLCTNGAHFVLTCDETELYKYMDTGFEGLQDLPTKAFTPWKSNFNLVPQNNQGRIIASPVAFTSKAFNTVPYTHESATALWLASNIFENTTLHKRIREQGGAYGGGAVNNAMSGNFYFYSYRDPNIFSTLKAFEEAIKKVASGKFEISDLEAAKLESAQTLDAPVAPGSRAEVAYSWWRSGKTLEMRQAHKTALLNMTAREVTQAVEDHVVPQFKDGSFVVFAGKELLEKENKKLEGHSLPPLHIEKV